MSGRRYFWRGVYVACGAILCGTIAFLVLAGSSYHGTCGGFVPSLAGSGPCTLWEYVFGDMLLFALLLGSAYWPLVLMVVVLPPFLGYLIDRRSKRRPG